jgi:hypothetical protein
LWREAQTTCGTFVVSKILIELFIELFFGNFSKDSSRGSLDIAVKEPGEQATELDMSRPMIESCQVPSGPDIFALVGHHLYRVGLPTLVRLAISSMVKSRTDSC